MGKYDGLGRYLREQRSAEVPMTFAEIERVTGTKLPPSARKHRPWWSNNPNNSVMTKVWLEAGFQTERVNMESGRLVFRRAGPTVSEMPAPRPALQRRDAENRHPLFGLMRGLTRIAPGTDLTRPADPDWGKD